jgi:CubicO group peptidase (beta-lactamase class C family)
MLKKLSAIIFCFCLFSFVSTGYTAKAEESVYQSAITTARIEIWKALSSGTASSATVAIMDEGKIVYSEGFGMRDREKSLPVDTNTQFNIGSISKIFTAAAILLLSEEGKVALDQPVTAYLPEFTMKDARYQDITVRMLLNHSSGFPGTNMKDSMGKAKNRNYIEQTLALLKESTLKYNPGEISIYCNDGLTVAEAIIEKVSGMSYADFLEKRIFSKLEMKNSSCYFKEGNSNIALAYDNQKGKAYPVEYVNALASGGISSTAEDLCRYAQEVFSDKILKPESLEEFQKPQFAPKTVPLGLPLYQYGLGWDTVSIEKFFQQGITVLSKSGGTVEFTSMVYTAPKEKLSIALIFTGSADTAAVCDQIMQALLEGKGMIKKSEDQMALPLKTISIPEDILSYAGLYGTNGNIIKVEFDKENHTLKFNTFADGEFVTQGVFPYLEDGFFHIANQQRISFTENYGSKFMMSYQMDTPGGMVVAENIQESKAKVEGSAFDGKLWLPRNLTATELGVSMLKTGLIKDLPGYIYLYDGSYTPYELLDKYTTKMSLQYARDLAEPKLVEHDGEMLLEVGNYVFSDTAMVADLEPGEKITINQYERNECRRIKKEVIFQSTIPEGGRIIVFSPEQEVIYDSLIDGVKEIVAGEQSYLIFVGNAGDQFEPEISYE